VLVFEILHGARIRSESLGTPVGRLSRGWARTRQTNSLHERAYADFSNIDPA
jgi:hypothetical protein